MTSLVLAALLATSPATESDALLQSHRAKTKGFGIASAVAFGIAAPLAIGGAGFSLLPERLNLERAIYQYTAIGAGATIGTIALVLAIIAIHYFDEGNLRARILDAQGRFTF